MSIYTATTPKIVPGKYGNAEIEYIPELDRYTLTCNGVSWMETESDCMHTKNTMCSQYDLAYGDVLITGLGFGILTTAISEKDNVTSVTVLELSQDVIDAFLANNQPNNKVKIIKADACKYTTEVKYDCLFLDHYELQTFKWRIKDMNNIAQRIKHDTFWPWSLEEIFLKELYPRYKYDIGSAALFEQYGSEMPEKWREFINSGFNSHPTLIGISDELLIGYLKKTAIYYYDVPNPYQFF